MLPLSPLLPRRHEKRAIWLEIQRDGPCRGNVRDSGFGSMDASVFMKLDSQEAESEVNNL